MSSRDVVMLQQGAKTSSDAGGMQQIVFCHSNSSIVGHVCIVIFWYYKIVYCKAI